MSKQSIAFVALVGVVFVLVGVLLWSLEPVRLILWSIGGGMLTWSATSLLFNWVDPSHREHYVTTLKIYDVVNKRCLGVEDERRNGKSRDFYQQFYEAADCVKVSGLALQGFISTLTGEEWRRKYGKKHLLKLMEQRPMKVEVILMSPESDVIKNDDAREPAMDKGKHARNVCQMLKDLVALDGEVREGKLVLHPGSRLDVRLSEISLNTTLFFTEGAGTGHYGDRRGVLLMGMLYLHKPGETAQLFRVPEDREEGSLYKDCLRHFDALFDLCADHQFLVLDGGKSRLTDQWSVLENSICAATKVKLLEAAGR